MQKTKLGISVGLLGAALYFSGLYGGYMISIVLAGYVLLFEENAWLKKAAVKAVALMIGFSLLTSLIHLIPGAIGLIDSVLNIFKSSFHVNFITTLVNAIDNIVGYIEVVLFIVLGIKAINQGNVSVPVIDKLINKYFD